MRIWTWWNWILIPLAIVQRCASMAVGRKSVCSGEVVEVESDRPIRSSVIVTAYLSRKKSRNSKLDAEVGRREKESVSVDFLTASSVLYIYFGLQGWRYPYYCLLTCASTLSGLTSSRDYLLLFPTLSTPFSISAS